MAKRIGFVFLAMIVTILGIGVALPSKWHVEQSLTVAAAPETVYAFIGDLKRWPDWTGWNTTNDAAVQWKYSGPATGAGATMEWKGPRMGTGRVQLLSADPKSGVKFDVVFQGHVPANGGFTLSGADHQTVVTWVMDGDVGRNPIVHLFVPQLRGALAAQLQEGLGKLDELAKARQGELDRAPPPAVVQPPAAP